MAYAVAQQLGFPPDDVEWVRSSGTGTGTGTERFDFEIGQIPLTDGDTQSLDLSSPYYDVRQAVVSVLGSPIANATSLDDLQSARLGAQLGTTGQSTLTTVIRPAMEPVVYDRWEDATNALIEGRVDGLVVDLPRAFSLAAGELDGGKVIGQVETSGSAPPQFGIALPPESPLTACVSRAVENLRDLGELEQIEAQWLTDNAGAPVLR
jgi:polar amino acid transport system substrate-binding protein